jgi:hypothetical protein
MSGLYLHLSKGHDNVERAAEASGGRFDFALENPSRLRAMSVLTRSLAAVLLVFSSMACDDAGPTTPDDSGDVAPTFTETFSGSLNPNGAITFPFTALAKGSATATLSSILPDNTVLLGFAMGTWFGNNCTAVISKDNAFEFSTITGSIGSAGALCLRVYDANGLGSTVKFTVTVVHP